MVNLCLRYSQSLRASHGVAAVEAFVAGAVTDRDRATDITGGSIIQEMGELGVELLQGPRLSLQRPGFVGHGRADERGNSARQTGKAILRSGVQRICLL